MYAGLDAIRDAEARAEAVAFNDRMRYAAFLEEGENFIAKHGLIVGGPAATRLLLGESTLTLNSFRYDLFSGRVAAHARALGDTLYKLDPQGLGHYTTVLTKVADHLLIVAVDGRDLFTLTSLPNHQGIRIADVIIPSNRPALFAKNSKGAPLRLLCMGPDIQLIGIYADLCNPAKAAEWENLLGVEASLRTILNKELRGRAMTTASELTGGGGAGRLPRFRQILWDKYVTGPGRVLIGPAAIAQLTKKTVAGEDRLQVITAGSLDGAAQEVAALAKTAGIEIAWKIGDPKIPTDLRMRRMTVHTVIAGRREPVLDVYNSAGYDLVPYLTISTREGMAVKIGTPFVLMRYRLIDMWTVQILVVMGAINKNFATVLLKEIASGYQMAAAHYESVAGSCSPKSAADQLIPLAAYIGQLEDSEVALKRAAQASARFFPPYFPASRASGGAPASSAEEEPASSAEEAEEEP